MDFGDTGAAGGGVFAEQAISVAIRLRPFSTRELADQGGRDASPWQASESSIWSEDEIGTKQFTFDRILPAGADNEATYNAVARRVIQAALRGINGTVFTYGQTGSGKTHSMLGTGADPGIIYRAVSEVFEFIAADTARAAAAGRVAEWMVRLSYLEVYQEEVNDLLQPLARGRGRNLRILRDDPLKGA
jgi:centromeric protein E